MAIARTSLPDCAPRRHHRPATQSPVLCEPAALALVYREDRTPGHTSNERSPAIITPLGHKHPSRFASGALCGPRRTFTPGETVGKRRSTQESLNVTLCRSTNRTTSHSSPQRLTKISRNRHAKHAPRTRRPRLRVFESRSTCGFLTSLGMSIVFQIDEGGERDLNSVRPAVNKK